MIVDIEFTEEEKEIAMDYAERHSMSLEDAIKQAGLDKIKEYFEDADRKNL